MPPHISRRSPSTSLARRRGGVLRVQRHGEGRDQGASDGHHHGEVERRAAAEPVADVAEGQLAEDRPSQTGGAGGGDGGVAGGLQGIQTQRSTGPCKIGSP